MELELWSETSAAISAIAGSWERHSRDQHPTALIVRVYHWAALHDRPIGWACKPGNWKPSVRPATLPDQSTMSRRARRADFMAFLQRVGERLNGKTKPMPVKVIDGKPLELPNHSTDRDAAWGRGVSRMSIGYKIHAVFSGNPMPDAVAITPLNICEKQMAKRLIPRIGGYGYLLSDAHYDASWLFDFCHHHRHQLLCPRGKPGTGEGHHYISEHRRRAIAMLEIPKPVSTFGTDLYARRTDIERDFAQLTCFGAGLSALPTWVRRIWRVRHWVMNKLLINAARIRINRRKAVNA
jgi:Transposase DDE domain